MPACLSKTIKSLKNLMKLLKDLNPVLKILLRSKISFRKIVLMSITYRRSIKECITWAKDMELRVEWALIGFRNHKVRLVDIVLQMVQIYPEVQNMMILQKVILVTEI